jgi:hypothetical protein
MMHNTQAAQCIHLERTVNRVSTTDWTECTHQLSIPGITVVEDLSDLGPMGMYSGDKT